MKNSFPAHLAPSRFHVSLAATLLLAACGGQPSAEEEGAATETVAEAPRSSPGGEKSQAESPTAPSDIADVRSALLGNCPTNLIGVTTSGACYCPPLSSYGSLWGTGVYSTDSHLCASAVHSGIITASTGGNVSYSILSDRNLFCGSTQNGVTSSGHGGSYASYTVGGAEILVARESVTHDYSARRVFSNEIVPHQRYSACLVKPVTITFNGSALLAIGNDGTQQVLDAAWAPDWDSYSAISTTRTDCASTCN